ncbi:DUF5719 family protein [Homoserinibacter sp. GY 40078]|uniref:DUF5719 family protein n=1 Tax=Homoserinibacter sp. GY 40078 TaxID=2603275 RepID=UPI0011C8C57F|nr:DUF5719 family protein [Homoserinibacter sp. GY 40078]TXK16276.1 hypothetical protein FVQ89_13545 [Homoserinibacter sp. GY 40078]
MADPTNPDEPVGQDAANTPADDEVTSHETTSHETTSHGTTPDEPTPDQATHDEATPDESTADATPRRTPRARSSRARSATLVSLRIVRGVVGIAAAAVVVGTVGLVPVPTSGISPLGVTVDPEPADLQRLCAGSLVRLGDDTGADAGRLTAIGAPTVTTAATGGEVRSSALTASDVGTGGTSQAPRLVELDPADDAALDAVQAQRASGEGGLAGLAVSGCPEPTSSAWLVGGDTTVGRTTLLLLANPTEVAAEVTLRMWGEDGEITAPGMSLTVAPGEQRVLPLSGFAPGVASPVVQVLARGGQVTAALQTSVIRVLDPGGVAIVQPGTGPSRETVIPGVRIFDDVGVSTALGLADYADLEAVARLANPGDVDASVEVSLLPTETGGVASSFQIEVAAGDVVDIPLTSGLELGSGLLPDGSYTVTLRSDQPVVAAVRAGTTPAPASGSSGSPDPGPADIAWFASAPTLSDDVLVAVASAPRPVLVVANPENTERTVVVEQLGGGPSRELVVPAAGTAQLTLTTGAGYALRDIDGLRAAIGYAGAAQLAGSLIRPEREADQAIVVRP